MKIENQVVSLELAKKLKEAGYPQEGVWWWVDGELCIENKKNWKYPWHRYEGEKDFALLGEKVNGVAPTVSELIYALSEYSGEGKQDHRLCLITPDNLAKWWFSRKDYTNW